MRNSIDIVLADHETLFLDSLSAALNSRGHRVLAATHDRAELVAAAARHEPDLCVIDSHFPDGDGIAAIGEILSRLPAANVVVLTADDGSEIMRRALDAGARGFVHKSRGLDVVLRVLERVVGGKVTAVEMSPPRPRTDAESSHRPAELTGFLTPREIECLKLLAAGMDTAQMALRLGVSPATVRSHIQAVLTKLGARTRLEAATFAIRRGLLRDRGPDVARGA